MINASPMLKIKVKLHFIKSTMTLCSLTWTHHDNDFCNDNVLTPKANNGIFLRSRLTQEKKNGEVSCSIDRMSTST